MRGDATIFALSSGAPPCAIAVVRVSGSGAADTVRALAGSLPQPRLATLRPLRDPDGGIIDRALLLWFPGPSSATGEDVVEFHLHGGTAVVARLLAVLAARPGHRPAEAGEFSRRALLNGRLDLIEAEGLSDLLLAETEAERRAAFSVFDGMLGQVLDGWRGELLGFTAEVEALIDMEEEADVAGQVSPHDLPARLVALALRIEEVAGSARVEGLRDGARVVIAGPPNSGKSSLLNMLVGHDAALVTPVAGTTRDLIEVPAAIAGRRFRLTDTAGLRDTADTVEALGVVRAQAALATADLCLWTDDVAPTPAAGPVLWLNMKSDLPHRPPRQGQISVSSRTGEGRAEIVQWIATAGVPAPDGLSLNERQREAAVLLTRSLRAAADHDDLLLTAEELHLARTTLDRLTGRADLDSVLDTLFGRFCVGK